MVKSLNPFENQVYFYACRPTQAGVLLRGLNPFENQVYFYMEAKKRETKAEKAVLIPLRIRSISTPCYGHRKRDH